MGLRRKTTLHMFLPERQRRCRTLWHVSPARAGVGCVAVSWLAVKVTSNMSVCEDG